MCKATSSPSMSLRVRRDVMTFYYITYSNALTGNVFRPQVTLSIYR